MSSVDETWSNVYVACIRASDLKRERERERRIITGHHGSPQLLDE